jgi:DNA polymerase-3 subunit delta
VTLTLVTGGDPFLMRQRAMQVRDSLARSHVEADVLSVDCADPAAAAAITEALSPSLFSATSVVVLWAAEEASEATIETLAALLADPGGNRVVVVHSGTKSRKTLERLAGLEVPGGKVKLECRTPKRGRETRDFLAAQANRAGRRLSADAAEALALAVGADMALLVGALEQVMSDFPDDPITAADVATMFTGVAEVTGFGFADALWGRDPRAALIQYRWGEQTSSLSLPAATGAAAAGLRSMIRVRSAPRGMSDADVARLAGVPPFKVRALREQAASWSDQELAAAVVTLARTDGAVKGGIMPGENLDPCQKGHALERWVRSTGAAGSLGESGGGTRRPRG